MNTYDEMNQSRKSVLFLLKNAEAPGTRIRVFNLLPELRKEGYEPECMVYPQSLQQKIQMLKRCRQFDVVIVRRKLLSLVDTTLLRKYTKKLIFDFDDAIYYRSDFDARFDLDSKSRIMKFKYLAKNADLVIAGNKILADYVKRLNSNVHILPSAVETREVARKNYDVSSDKTIIGWVGGAYNLHHLQMLSPVLQKLSSIYKIQVRILCSSSVEIPSVDVKFIPWRLEMQDAEIAEFDIGVMPLPNNRSTEGKCGYKALQYMAAEIPPVVSDVGINREIVEHKLEGFVLKSINGFYDALKVLIENRALRKQMGEYARKKVERQYSVQVIAKQLVDILRH